MILAYINEISNTNNTLVSSSEDTTRPLSNLRNKEKSVVFRSGSFTGTYVQVYNVNGISADYIAILNHNIPATAAIYIQGNDTNNFTSPEFSAQITLSEDSEDKAYKFSTTLLTYKYWRLYITATVENTDYNQACYSGEWITTQYTNTANGVCFSEGTYLYDVYGATDSDTSTTTTRPTIGFCWGELTNYYTPTAPANEENYVEIGIFFLGQSLTIDNQRQTMKIDYNTNSRRVTTLNGGFYGSTLYAYRTTNIELPILSRSRDEKGLLTTFYEYVRNYGYFICQLWDEDTTEEKPFYCVYDDNNMSFKKEPTIRYPFSTSIKIREVN